ncbi:MAG: hypothetical protein MUE42_15905 [Opitutaceae bacterium]|nr:hypothetical protein [Opitutaceae bacterium]
MSAEAGVEPTFWIKHRMLWTPLLASVEMRVGGWLARRSQLLAETPEPVSKSVLSRMGGGWTITG